MVLQCKDKKMERLNYWIQTTTLEKIKTKTKTKKDNSMSKVSLYDYLGHAAGSELGQKVATAARQAGVRGEMREVANPKYTGPVMLWPRAFLDLYFKGGLNEGTTGKQLLKG